MIVYFKPNPTPNLRFGWSLGLAEPDIRSVSNILGKLWKIFTPSYTAQLEDAAETEKNHNKGRLQKLRHASKVFSK